LPGVALIICKGHMLQCLKYHMSLYINLVISAWEGNRKNNAITLYKE